MAKKIITDEELTLKRQARRRLIGAIALTIMVVILLPMVLDNEPPAPTQDIELQIPDKDKAGEFVPKMVLPPLSAASAVPQPAASAPVIAPLLDVKPPGMVAQPKVETQPVVENKPKVEQQIMPTENKPKAEVKPAVVKPAIKASGKPADKTHSGFVLQVGAFANADAAKKLQEKLHKQGYPSYTEKAGDKTRVRVGDYTTHAEAEKVQRKLEIQGMKPDVINLN
jgi:DedD protein